MLGRLPALLCVLLAASCGSATEPAAADPRRVVAQPPPEPEVDAPVVAAEEPDVAVEERAPPPPVSARGRVVHLAAGDSHTCALHETGLVTCWGRDVEGQLGDGEDGGGELVLVVGLDDAVAIAAGPTHSCAIRRGGRVVCWGLSAQAREPEGEGRRASDRPEAVAGVEGAEEIVCGGFFTCARLGDGSVTCWGRGAFGNHYEVAGPTPAEGIAGAVQIAAAKRSLVVRRGDGQVQQCGFREGRRAETGCRVVIERGARDIAAGGHSSDLCVIDVRERLRCFADGEPLTAGFRRGRDATSDVALGRSHTCALRGGRVDCWGAPEARPPVTSALQVRPRRPTRLDLEGVVELAAGAHHHCALDGAGAVHCWGANDRRQLAAPSPADHPVGIVDGLDDATAISGTCALRANGAVRCWGSENPALPAIEGATAIADGGGQVCAIVAGGRVRCWFRSARPSGERHTFQSVVPGIRDATLLSLGGESGCTLDARRRPRCWGLGAARAPRGISEAADIACADAECCAVLSDGTVSCWSEDYFVHGCSDCGHTGQAPYLVEDLADVVSILSDSRSFCARRSTGRVDCWRSVASGHSGLEPAGALVEVEGAAAFATLLPRIGATTEGRVRYIGAETPPEAARIEGVVEVSESACARLSDGRVECWDRHGAYADEAFGGVASSGPRAIIAAPSTVNAAEP